MLRRGVHWRIIVAMDLVLLIGAIAGVVILVPVSVYVAATTTQNILRLFRHWDVTKPPKPIAEVGFPGGGKVRFEEEAKAKAGVGESLNELRRSNRSMAAAIVMLADRIAVLERKWLGQAERGRLEKGEHEPVVE